MCEAEIGIKNCLGFANDLVLSKREVVLTLFHGVCIFLYQGLHLLWKKLLPITAVTVFVGPTLTHSWAFLSIYEKVDIRK